MTRFLCTVAVACLLADSAAAEQGIYPLADVEPGLRGTGLSVFRGETPEAFDVEVLGVWREVSPGTSYILARLTGQGLEESGVIAGMSGSPVYVGERLLGAVAFSWPFSQEPIAGITPIETMRELDTAEPAAPSSAGVARFDPELLTRERLPEDLLLGPLSRLTAQPVQGGASGLLWSLSGFGEWSRSLLARGLQGGVATAGRHLVSGAAGLEAGDAVAAVLVDGDLRLAATGTVTERSADRILAFGHPFLGLGDLRVPMARAEVVTVVPSRAVSFKLANTGAVVGAFDLDRSPGIRGRIGLEAPTIPVGVAIRGERDRDFVLRVADLPQLMPTLLAVGILGSLDATTQTAGAQTVGLRIRLDVRGRPSLELQQVFEGEGASLQAALWTLALTGFVLQNDYGEVALEGVEVTLDQTPVRRAARVGAAHPDRRVVKPGDRVTLAVEVRPYRGEPSRRELVVTVPEGLPDGKYFLLVGDGTSMTAARLGVEKSAPETLDQALGLLRSIAPRNRLVASGLFAAAGLRVAGEALPQLPGSIQSLWRAADPVGYETLELAWIPSASIESDVPLTGVTRVDLEVRRDGIGNERKGGE